MSNFNVGDRVKFVDASDNANYKRYVGNIYKVTAILNSVDGAMLLVQLNTIYHVDKGPLQVYSYRLKKITPRNIPKEAV